VGDYLQQITWTNHYDRPIQNTEPKYVKAHNSVAHFTSHGKLHEFGAEKPISCAKLAQFDSFAINFTLWSHILSTVGYIILNSQHHPHS
jgi:hypothetical protein